MTASARACSVRRQRDWTAVVWGTSPTKTCASFSWPWDLVPRQVEWHFVVPYLTLMRADAPQRRHDLRAVFNALRWLVRIGAQWAYLPHEFPA